MPAEIYSSLPQQISLSKAFETPSLSQLFAIVICCGFLLSPVESL